MHNLRQFVEAGAVVSYGGAGADDPADVCSSGLIRSSSSRVLDQRGQLLRAAVGFAGCSMPSYDRALTALRTWLDSWSGIGRIAAARRACSHPVQQSRNALIVFEARNLFAIGASLVGFNYMPQLVSSPCTFGALWGGSGRHSR
jgi:hypothetical protein